MFLTPFAKPNLSFSLTIEDEIFLTLVRLRLVLIYEDLAHRFDISVASVSRIFQKWVDIMFAKLRFLIAWPQRDVIRQNMPPLFKSLYPRCCCIIDCSEIFINIPSSYSARSKTYSDYKKHNFIKFLTGVTPWDSTHYTAGIIVSYVHNLSTYPALQVQWAVTIWPSLFTDTQAQWAFSGDLWLGSFVMVAFRIVIPVDRRHDRTVRTCPFLKKLYASILFHCISCLRVYTPGRSTK